MANETNTPATYTMYDQLYDFNDLQLRADKGVNEFIYSLKKGKKHYDDFINAYTDIMNGIKDGTITFLNGQYHDSTGTRHNVDSKHKDYYGLMAYYIHNKLKKGKLTEPKADDKLKWEGSASMGRDLVQRIFNSTNANALDFIDLEDLRIPTLSAAFDYIGSDENLNRYNLTDADRASLAENIAAAKTALLDGSVDKGDFLALSRAAGGIDFRSLFGVALPKQEATTIPDFVSYMQSVAPLYMGQLASKDMTTNAKMATADIQSVYLKLSNLSDNDINLVVRACLLNPKFNFASNPIINKTLGGLNVDNNFGMNLLFRLMQKRGMMEDLGNNLLRLPNTDSKRFTTWVWDNKNKKLQEIRMLDIAAEAAKWRSNYFSTYMPTAADPTIALYYQANPNFEGMVASKKNGGILKALKGIKTKDPNGYYNYVFSKNLDHILNGLEGGNDDYAWWLNDMLDKHADMYAEALKLGTDKDGNFNFYNSPYKLDNVTAYLDEYKKGFNSEFGDNKAGYNSLGILNAASVGLLFLMDGERTSGDWAYQDPTKELWKSDGMYSGITDWRRLLGRKGDFTDEQLADIVSKFKAKGYNFIEGANGYYKLEKLVNNPVLPDPVLDPTKVEDPAKVEDPNAVKKPGSRFTPTPPPVPKDLSALKTIAGTLGPNLSKLGIAAMNVRDNNKRKDDLLAAYRPALKNPDSKYSPVTGAFGEMLFLNGAAADLRFQAWRNGSSDNILNTFKLYEADRLAHLWETLGFLADNKEIKRTMDAAKDKLEYTHTLAINTANDNTASIINSIIKKAEIRNAASKANTDTWTNYLNSQVDDWNNRYKEKLAFDIQTGSQAISDEYTEYLRDLNNLASTWQSQHPGLSLTSWDGYQDYLDTLEKANKWRRSSEFANYARANGWRYYKSPGTLASYMALKSGGKLVSKKK